MEIAFSPKIIITEPEKLFGRSSLLKQLVSLANNGNSVSLIGLRRFGKTSLLKCLETSLRTSDNSRCYPLFFDFKEVGSIIKGTDNVYKYMISIFVTQLFKDGHFREEILFKKVLIKPNEDWEDIYESLIDVNSVRIQGVFEEVVTFFSEILDKTILFLFDEYEWLFRFSFDEPIGFMKLRNFSSRPSNNGFSFFSFWIAGATSWDHLCTLTGSAELNVIDAPPLYIKDIDQESFSQMWNAEVKKVNNCPEKLRTADESAYTASGGIPFYGKLIGNYYLTSQIDVTSNHLKSHFSELYENLQIEEKSILKDLSKSSQRMVNSKFLYELQEKGLIHNTSKNIYEIKSSYFKEFIKLNFTSEENGSDSSPKSHGLSDTVSSLIMNINNTHKNKKNTYIFEPVVDDAALMKDLRTPCFSPELFADFSSSLYKIVFERTKGLRNGKDLNKAKLPPSFKKNNKFINIVDIMRHSLGGGHLMDTFSSRSTQISKAEMLEELTGSRNEPNLPEEFYQLQISTLKMFIVELKKLQVIVRQIK